MTDSSASDSPHGGLDPFVELGHGSDSPKPSAMIDIGTLARAARLRRCRRTLAVLWREVFGLRSWFFVAEPSSGGESDVISEVCPLVVERDGRRRVLVFTDEFTALQHERRASGGPGGRGAGGAGGAGSRGATPVARGPGGTPQPSDEETAVVSGAPAVTPPCAAADGLAGAKPPTLATLELSIEAALSLFDRLARDGVFAATFDDGQESFEAPLSMLRRVQRAVGRIKDAPPPGGAGGSGGSVGGTAGHANDADLDDGALGADAAALEATTVLGLPRGKLDLAELIERGGAGGVDREIAVAALLRLDDWWFICNPRDPDSIYIRRFDGTPAVMAFTDERRAILATDRYGVIDSDGCILLLQLPVADAVTWIQSFREQGVHDLAFDAVGVGIRMPIEEIEARWRALNGRVPDGGSREGAGAAD